MGPRNNGKHHVATARDEGFLMPDNSNQSPISRIAFIGNYLPRQCGIATFTTDLCEAIAAEHSDTTCIAVPVNDIEGGYAYPARVRFELTEKDIESYRRAADFLNINSVDLVCLQFEYGIFGGRAGSHILALLRDLRVPIVTTLHTILREPDAHQRKVLIEVAGLSDRLVVMSKRGAEFLQEIYHVSPEKIDLIPHGIPDLPFVDPSFHKDLFGVEGKIVLLSFGLLSANKGIENVISALPAILAKHPNVVYFIVGATHPHVIRHDGEAYRFSLQWLAQEKGVEGRYMESFQRARAERRHFSAPGFVVKALDKRPAELPALNLDHLRRMTDDTGMFQHAIFTVPNYREGYTIDDNARALTVSALLEELGSEETSELTSRYFAFVWYAFNSETGRFRNFMNYQRNWLEENGSDDSHGRTLWALGTVLGRSNTPALQSMAGWVFEKALPAILQTSSPRAWAFALIGIHEYLHRFAGDRRVGQVREQLAERLLKLYQTNRADEWRWYEKSLTYCNAALPHALLMCGQGIPNNEMSEAGLESLSWLADLQHAEEAGGYFVPIGSNGFYQRGGERARFDQQPVEAQAMVSACLEAHRITGDKSWNKEARCAFDWFLGRNDLDLPIYDPTTGGCRDGLHPDRPNENQGAESSLAYLQAVLELRLAETTFASVETGESVARINQ